MCMFGGWVKMCVLRVHFLKNRAFITTKSALNNRSKISLKCCGRAHFYQESFSMLSNKHFGSKRY